MAAIALTAAQIAPVHPESSEIYDFVCGVTVTKGQIVYVVEATGLLDLADANGATDLLQPTGIALQGGGAGQAISVLKRGMVYGYTISALGYFDPAYLSDTAGGLDTAAGTVSILLGRVIPLSNVGLMTKVLYFEARWTTIFA